MDRFEEKQQSMQSEEPKLLPALENRNVTLKQREDENKLSFKKNTASLAQSAEAMSQNNTSVMTAQRVSQGISNLEGSQYGRHRLMNRLG
jgi:hypothetical protein